MAIRCDECRKPVRGQGHRTVVRVLCDQCYDKSVGAVAGLLSGGTVGDAASTSGWFSRLRARKT